MNPVVSALTVATPPDFTPITDQITTFGPAMATALGVVFTAGLAVTAIIWGGPRIVSFFKRVAK